VGVGVAFRSEAPNAVGGSMSVRSGTRQQHLGRGHHRARQNQEQRPVACTGRDITVGDGLISPPALAVGLLREGLR